MRQLLHPTVSAGTRASLRTSTRPQVRSSRGEVESGWGYTRRRRRGHFTDFGPNLRTAVLAAAIGFALALVADASAAVGQTPPPLQLPFPEGASWWANGPHSDDILSKKTCSQVVCYNVDLGPPQPDGPITGTIIAAE